MARSYLTPINLNGNTIYNAALHPQGTAPSTTAQGQVWYDTANKIVKIYDGSWNAVGNAIASAGGPTTTPSSAGSFYFDTTNLDLYVANGTTNSANWKPAASGSLIPLSKLAAPTANYDISGSGFTIRATTPVNALDVVNKSYADTIATGLNAHDAVSYASTANLTGTYNNGTSGVGAKLTNSGTQAVFALDGYTFQASDVTNGTRVLLKDQTFADQNGIYVITVLGSASTNWELTRASDYDTFPEVSAGDFAFVTSGTANGKFTYVQISKPTQISGTGTAAGAITFSIFANGNISGTVTVGQGGTGLTSYTIGDLVYASGTTTLAKLADVATGNVLLSGGVGAAPSYGQVGLTTHVTGTLPIGNGGTNITTYTTGDLLYASASNTLAKLSGNTTTTKNFLVQTGNGSISAAPSWAALTVSDVATAYSNASVSTGGAITAQYAVTQKLAVTLTSNGSLTSWTITHSFSRFVLVQVADSAGLQVECDVTNTAGSTVVAFATAPAAGTYYVTIIG
jgi:hypothetical protein